MQTRFISGLDLSEALYSDAVRPLLDAAYPKLLHSAALLGPGSEVLGYDTEQSMDHDWGPRLMLFLTPHDHDRLSAQIRDQLRHALPHAIRGIPTNLATTGGDRPWAPAPEGLPTGHGVQILTVQGLTGAVLGFDPLSEIRARDWLSVPQQHLLSLTSGQVFHDGLGDLARMRAALRFYPHDVWLYLLASQWARIGQECHFMGRCGQLGDDLGSRLIAERLVKDVMRLCFLMERRYAPYIKWFGTAFTQLDCAKPLQPILEEVLRAGSWPERERHLSAAYALVAGMHNKLGITEPVPAQVSRFHERPFLVIGTGAFQRAILAAVTCQEVRDLPRVLGSVDQFLDSTDALNHVSRFRSVFESTTG